MTPRNGLYTTSDRALQVRLELQSKDSAGGVVSGDLFRANKLHSFLSSKPVQWAGSGNGSSREGKISTSVRFGPRNFATGSPGSLRLDFTSPKSANAEVRCSALGIDERLAVKWRSKYYRRLTIELDKVATARFPGTVSWKKTKRDLARIFRDAGFDTTVKRSNRDVPDDPSGWTDGELHSGMERYRQGKPTPWYTYVLLVSNYSEDGQIDEDTLGIMFDFGDEDINGIPREGSATFMDPHKQSYTKQSVFNREILMTIAHEIGHTLNLYHSFDPEKGRPDSASIMNYPHMYDYGEAAYYADFDFSFDALELRHLHHHSPLVTEPGNADGQEFGRDIFRVAPGGARAARLSPAKRQAFHGKWEKALREEQPELEDELALKLDVSSSTIFLGEPIKAMLSLTRVRGGDLPFRTALDWGGGFVRIQVREKGAAPWIDLHPPILRCHRRAERFVLPRGQTSSVEIPLVISREGELFRKTGAYEIRARLQLRWKDKPHRIFSAPPPVQVTVRSPETTEERELAGLLRQPELRRSLVLPGAVLDERLRESMGRILELGSARYSGKLARSILVSEALNRILQSPQEAVSAKNDILSMFEL